MRPKVKTARRKASKLHGASAGYVSIVDRGAAETPFTMIKSNNGASAMSIKKRGKPVKAAKSHKKIPAQKKREEQEFRTETMMAKMVFSADVFEDEQDVRDWITEAEWEADSIQVTKNADGDFEARPNDLTDEDFEKIASVEVEEEGVSAFVGERKIFEDMEEDATDDEADEETKAEDDAAEDEEEATETKSEDDADADDEVTEEEKMGNKKKPRYSKRAEFLAKRKEKATKFDTWDAAFSDGNTVMAVIKDATDWDGTPAGFHEVNLAFNVAMGNILKDDGLDAAARQEGLNKAAADFAEIVGGLDSFFSAYTDDSEAVEARFPVEKREKVAKWAEDFADWLNDNDPDKKDEVSDEDDAEKAEKKSVKKSADVVTIDYSKVADLVAKAVEPLTERVDAVTGTVESLASRRPSKKAVASDDSGNAAPLETEKKSAADEDKEFLAKKQVKGLFG